MRQCLVPCCVTDGMQEHCSKCFRQRIEEALDLPLWSYESVELLDRAGACEFPDDAPEVSEKEVPHRQGLAVLRHCLVRVRHALA